MSGLKRAVVVFTSTAIAVSAFSAFVISASANVTKYSNDWETAGTTGFTDAGRGGSSLVTDFGGNTGTCVEMHNTGGAKGTQKMEIGTISGNKVYIEFDIYFTNEAGSKYVAVGSGLGRMGTDSYNDIDVETGIALALQNYTDGTIYVNEADTGIATQQWLKVSAVADFTTKKVAVTITPKTGDAYNSTVDFMDDTIENINSITLNRYTNPTNPALYLDNFSVSVPELEYSDGSVRANLPGTVVVASYSSKRLTSAKTYDVEAGSTTAIDASDGDRIMFWDSKTNANPLIAPITVGGAATEEPTAVPTEEPTPTPEPTPEVAQIPKTIEFGGGQSFVAAPKTDAASTTEPFTVTVFDDGDKLIDSSKYSLEWAVYPAGTTTADDNVTISEGGIVSVSKNFMADGSVAAYDVVAEIEMKDAGQRGLNATKTIYVGKNDVIYYEPIAWSQAGGNDNRTGSVSIASAVTLPDLSSITLNLAMQEPEGQRTLFLVTNTGSFVGLQYQKADGKIVVGTGWSGNTNMNQYGDIDAFKNQKTLITGYKSNSPLEVTFTIDKTTNTVTVSSGTSNVSLPFAANTPTTFTGFKTGLYRTGGAMTMTDVTVTEPDQDYLSIVGDKDFAKVYGTTVTRDYALNQSIVVSGETFSWSVAPAGQGVTVDNGKLSVAGSAQAGTYTLTATSNIRPTKTASLEIEVGGFQTISQANATIVGANTYGGIGQTGTYRITKLVDSYGDDVAALLPAAVWTSNNTSVAVITESGELTVTGKGTATLTATITNGTAVSTFTVPINVDIYFISADATGNSTAVDTSGLITAAADSAITGYQVTTSKNGKFVKQSVVTTAPTTVDTTGADKFEIAPVFTVKGVTRSASKTISVPADTYNFNITGASGGRFDPYVNDQMLANNMLQGGTALNKLAINDVVVNEGYATIKLEDAQSNSNIGTLTVVKSPSIVDRVRKVYVLGDSLVCIYYNGGNASNNYQTGWGQVLQSYLTDDYEVVDLGNSGVTAEGLAGTAITQVAVSGKPGDIMLLESGYNDRSYISEERMKDAVRSMYDKATAAGVNAVLVTPNASAHDFKSNVSWSGFMKDVANEKNAKLIDLAALSYNFFTSVGYTNAGEPKATYNISDSLHSTYHGAHKMASIVAGGMIDAGLGDAVNTSYTYTFQDSLGKTITCQAAASN